MPEKLMKLKETRHVGCGDDVRRLYKKGYSCLLISKILGVPESTVKFYVKEMEG